MNNRKCLTCVELKRCRESFSSWVFFMIGIVATIAVRVVTILMHINSIYGKIAWYIGVGGFFIFFLYRFNISRQRSKLIEKQGGKIVGITSIGADKHKKTQILFDKYNCKALNIA